jgi:hypothetical protein
MFNFEMDVNNYFTCLPVLELVLFVAAIITYGIYLCYMFVLFRIRIFNIYIYKYIKSMSLISLILQQYNGTLYSSVDSLPERCCPHKV